MAEFPASCIFSCTLKKKATLVLIDANASFSAHFIISITGWFGLLVTMKIRKCSKTNFETPKHLHAFFSPPAVANEEACVRKMPWEG